MTSRMCKKCYVCGITKPLDKFVRDNRKPEGRKGICKQCRNKQRREYMENNKEWRYKVQRKYYLSSRGYYTRLRSSAKNRGIGFQLEYNEFQKLFNKQDHKCHYCGCSLTRSSERTVMNRKNSDLTVDRLDNSIGYKINNIALCCRRCNMIKGNEFTNDEMLLIADMFIKPKFGEERC